MGVCYAGIKIPGIEEIVVLVEARHTTPVEASRSPTRASLTWSGELTTALLSAWIVAGLYLDGWAHHALPELETFFTPWHAALYSGLGATAGWIAAQALRGHRRGLRGAQAVPYGYGLGLLGIVLFGLAGLSDLAWHTAFGIEEDLAALLSPPHLALGAGAGLMITSPLRAARRRGAGEARPSLGRFLPVLLSVTLTVAAAAFFLSYVSAFQSGVATGGGAGAGRAEVHASRQVIEVSSVLITNVLLMAPLLAMLARWRIPFGSATLLFVAVAGLSSVEHSFEAGELLLAAAAGGVAADTLIALLRPSLHRPAAFRSVAVAIPSALWLAYFAVTALFSGLTWPAELWSGAIALAAVSGLGLSLLVASANPQRDAL